MKSHGHTKGRKFSPEYRAYRAMRQRCLDPNADNYPRYGGRGILICEQWLFSFEEFLRDMGPKPTPQHTLERMDVNGNYEPGNCRWATHKEQGNNKRCNRIVRFNGQSKTVSQWADDLGMSYAMLQSRLDRKWPLHLAFDASQTPSSVRAAKKQQSSSAQKEETKTRRCLRCQAEFRPKTRDSNYCSRKCGKAAARDRHYQKNRESINLKRRKGS